MRSLLLQLTLELRLMNKMRWPFLLPLIAGGWMLLQCLNSLHSSSTDINFYAADAHSTFMILLPAIPILLGVLLIRRDAMNASYEWMLGLPITNTIIIASKWMAAFLYASLFTLAIEMVYILFAWHQGLPWSAICSSVIYYSALYGCSFAVSAALGIVIGALMPLRFSLPIAFCGWVFGTLFLPGLLVRSYSLYPLKAFSLNHLLYNINNSGNEGWTAPLLREEYGLMYIFAAAFGLFILAASNALLARIRPVLHPKRPLFVMWVTLLISAAAYAPYGKLWFDRFQELHVLEASAPERNEAVPNEPYAFQIKSMKLDMTREEGNMLRMKATYVLPTQDGQLIPSAPNIHQVKSHIGGHVSFLLDPMLQVHSLLIDGQAVPWQRQGDLISFAQSLLSKKTEMHNIEFVYSGVIKEWKLAGNSEAFAAFVQDSSVFLPDYTGWFPLPGGDHLLMDKETLTERLDIIKYLRADFDLTLHGFDGSLFATIAAAPDDTPETRHFKEEGAQAPTLLGYSQIKKLTHADEPIAILTTAGNVQESETFLKELHQKRLYYEAWTKKPLTGISKITYMSINEQISGLMRRSPYGLYTSGDTLFVNAGKYQSITNRSQFVLGKLLFGDTVNIFEHVNEWDDYDDPFEKYSMVQEIRSAIINLPLTEQYAASEPTYLVPLPNEAAPVAISMQKMINAAFVNGQGDFVKRVLLHFLDKGLFIQDNTQNRTYSNDELAKQVPYLYPVITWKDWIDVWNEEKAGDGKDER